MWTTLTTTARLILAVLRGELTDSGSWGHAVQLGAAFLRDHALPTWDADDIAALDDERRRAFVGEVSAESRAAPMRYLIASGLTGERDSIWWVNQLAVAQDRADADSAQRAEAALASISASITHPTAIGAATRTAAASLTPDGPAAAIFDRYFGAAACQARADTQADAATLPQTSAQQILDQLDQLLADSDGRVLDVLGELGPTNLAWGELTPAQRSSLIAQARQHMRSDQADAATASDRQRLNAAHHILATLDREHLSAVPVSRWLAWLPSLLGAPDSVGPARTGIARSLDEAPASAETILIPALADPSVVAHLQKKETAQISQAGLDLVEQDEAITGNHLSYLLAIGATNGPDRAANIAKSIISRQHDSAGGSGRERAVDAAAALAGMPNLSEHHEDLLAHLRADVDFAKEVIKTTQHRQAWTGLTPRQLGELFVWADDELPQPQFPAPGALLLGNSVANFADELIEILAHPENIIAGPNSRSTAQSAIAVLNELAERPGRVFLRQRARRIQDTTLAGSPPAPVSEILAAIDLPNMRTVTTKEQFLQVLLAAIDAFGQEIVEDRAVRGLAWHRIRKRTKHDAGAWRPKDENELSTWICRELKRHLQARIALLREVEINPRLATIQGDRPDIVALALHTASFDVELNIIIEVKGNWHAEVLEAFETQLADRYLTGPAGATGIYLVCYFAGNVWDTKDGRRAAATRLMSGLTPSQLQKRLQADADRVISPETILHVRVLDMGLDAADADAIVDPDDTDP